MLRPFKHLPEKAMLGSWMTSDAPYEWHGDTYT